MASEPRPWTVLPHAPIERVSDRLWTVEGALPSGPLERRMTAIKRDDGSLMIHSAISLDDASMAELERYGDPSILIVPSRFHRLDAAAWRRRYPKMKVYCPKAARHDVSKVVSVDGDYSALPKDRSITAIEIDGVAQREAVFSIKEGGATTLLFNDLLFNVPHMSGVTGFALRYITASTGGPRVSRLARLGIVDHSGLVAKHLVQLACDPSVRCLIPGHGALIRDDAATVLTRVAKGL